MKRFVLVALPLVALAVVGAVLSMPPAHASDLAIQFGSGTPPGTMTLGGVTGQLSWSGGNWTMTVGGQTFATGTFNSLTGRTTVTSMPGLASCQAGCTTTVNPVTLSGTLSITNHGAFVSAVTNWAGANRTALRAAGLTIGSIVSSAARGSAHPAGQGNASAAVGTSATTTSKTNGKAGGTTGTGASTTHGQGGGSAQGTGGAHGGAGQANGASVGVSGSGGGGADHGAGHAEGSGHAR